MYISGLAHRHKISCRCSLLCLRVLGIHCPCEVCLYVSASPTPSQVRLASPYWGLWVDQAGDRTLVLVVRGGHALSLARVGTSGSASLLSSLGENHISKQGA